MNANELFKNSGIQDNHLPNRGVELKVHRMEYPFFIKMFNQRGDGRKEELEDFKVYINNLAVAYMEKWISKTEKKLQKDLYNLFNFQRDTDLEKVFMLIVGGGYNPAEILFKVSNARMEMRRFGNCLGIRMKANNGNGGPEEIHKDGTAILETFCQEQVMHMQKFLRCIECIVPLSREHGEKNSVIVDLCRTIEKIKTACPYIYWHDTGIAWDSILTTLTQELAYKYDLLSEIDVEAGSFQDEAAPDLFLRLVHLEENSTNKQVSWRKGNIEELGDGKYRFLDGRDLCLSLKINGFFPRSITLREIATNLNVRSQQGKMLLAGATLYSQLCCMTTNLFSPATNY